MTEEHFQLCQSEVSTDERAFLLGASVDGRGPLERTDDASMAELARLAETAGAQVAGYSIQNRDAADPRTYIGEGKLAEAKEFCEANDVNLLIFDDELSGSQIRNIEDATGIRTIDRTGLILDIFARHASTRESKCQVELAQLRYTLPRLTGLGKSLSRLGGGIGTRGPGESKLETDRRHIQMRIGALSRELKEIKAHREVLRRKRQKDAVPIVAIVGYTNAGKSSLLNLLTDAGTLAEDKLFATLDTLVRYKKVNEFFEMLLIDTVGFIRKLPHHLVDAFRSTLEEARYADLLLHVVDASSSSREEQIQVATRLLSEIGAGETPQVLVYNKIDAAGGLEIAGDSDAVRISCRTGEGIDRLLAEIQARLPKQKREIELYLPYGKVGLLQDIYRSGSVLSEEYVEGGVAVRCVVDPLLYGRVREFETAGDERGGI